jgi:hypothetical protein
MPNTISACRPNAARRESSVPLQQYFPQALEWCKNKDTVVFCDFLSRWPTLKQAKHAHRATLEAFFREHNVRYPHIIEERLQAIKTATPLTEGPAVITPHRLLVQALVEQLRVSLEAIERFDAETTTYTRSDPPRLFAIPCPAGRRPHPRTPAARRLRGTKGASRALRNSKSTPVSHPSPNAAARNSGCIGDYSAPSSYAKRSSNGPARPSLARSGPLPTIASSVIGDVPTNPPYAPLAFRILLLARPHPLRRIDIP